MTPFVGQRVAVMGLGRAGFAAALRLRDWGAIVTAWDDLPEGRARAEAAGLALQNPAVDFAADALLLSPGIAHTYPAPHPAAAAARAAGAPILSDVEFLFRAVRASGSEARFVGVTGTNGKSTVTAIIHHILTTSGRAAEVGGNLGPPALGLNMLGHEGIYTLEMSSYMLERLAEMRFNVAVMLNLSPDHLDRHGSMAGYAAAKAQVFARQAAGDTAVVGMDDAASAAMAAGRAGYVRPISANSPQAHGVWCADGVLRDEAGAICDLRDALSLPGAHNAQNAAAAAAACFALDVPRAAVAAGLLSYPGLPHRQERVAEIAGVTWINDSKATNADSAARALATYPRVAWIAGGIAKDGGIESLAPWFARVAKAYLIGQDAPVLAKTLAQHGVPHAVLGDLAAAVSAAHADAAAPVVLLSPACASWDQFSGFDARGDAFRAQVLALSGGAN
ncbi:MAG: UDP-N-acetylmuramoylalanine--D-glutamate ligase [Rhodospirillales bacterium]|nr:UDP-N-acetylmuramoylalanine--D-glutamate ligase [Rhodospirillales bacterium]